MFNEFLVPGPVLTEVDAPLAYDAHGIARKVWLKIKKYALNVPLDP